MKIKKLFLDDEDSLPVNVLVIKQKTGDVPEHEFFFHINKINNFNFSRLEDFCLNFDGNLSWFCQFECFEPCNQVVFRMIKNRSIRVERQQETFELFGDVPPEIYLLNTNSFDYVLLSPNSDADFASVKLPKQMVSDTEFIQLDDNEPLKEIIQYYEQ